MANAPPPHGPPPPPPETETNVANGHVGVFTSNGTFVSDFAGSGALVAGVGAAASGDVVVAGDGNYTGDLIITSAMTIESEHGANHVTTTGDGTQQQTGVEHDAAVEIQSGGVTVGLDGHGLTIQQGASEGFAVYVHTSAPNVLVEGNTIFGMDTATGGPGGAIVGDAGENHVTIDDNTIATGSVYLNGNSNSPGHSSDHVNFTDNHIDKASGGVVLDVSNSVISGNHFDGNDGVIALQSPGDTAFNNNAEIQTVNGGFTLHGNEILVTTDDGGSSSNFAGEHQETDQILNWDAGVKINLADNWPGRSVTALSTNQDGSNEVNVALSNGGEIDLFANHVTVAQVEHDYGFA